jgi:HEAT repeat protein
LYDTVRMANVPKNKILEATRGAILARQTDGLPLLLEQLKSPDKAFFGIGLRTARELPGTDVTKALVAALNDCPDERKAFLLLAVADRHDATALPAVYQAAQSGPAKLRLVAVGILDRQGSPASIPVLLTVAADNSAALKAAAISALARLSGPDVDSDLVARLPGASGRTRQALIEVSAQRRIAAALPSMVSSTEDSDAGVRSAAIQAVGVLGQSEQAVDLVKLLQKNPEAKQRAELETALVSLSGRAGAKCVPHIVVLEQNDEAPIRIVGLHVLGAAGGADALAAVKSAVEDKDAGVQDEAVRTLSTWPNNWPEDGAVAEPLLALAKSDKKTSHQVLGLRGYLQFVQGDKQLKNDDKIAKVKEAMPLIKRPEEQRLAIAILGATPTGDSLDLLVAFTEQAPVAADASSAIVQLADGKISGASKEQRHQALQAAMAKASNDDTKKKAQELLKKSE